MAAATTTATGHPPRGGAGGGAPASPRRARYRRWVAATAAGELAGFTVPAVAGVAVTAAGWGQAATVAAMVAAGTGEGALLGWAQSRALRRDLPTLVPADWVLATAAGAALAWAIGMAPSTFHDAAATWPPVLVAAAGVVCGVALLATIGVAQWTVLRRHLRASGIWVVANALGWLAGLPVAVAAVALAPDVPVLVAAAGVLGGIGMGLAVGLVTGAFLVRLLDRDTTGQARRRSPR